MIIDIQRYKLPPYPNCTLHETENRGRSKSQWRVELPDFPGWETSVCPEHLMDVMKRLAHLLQMIDEPEQREGRE